MSIITGEPLDDRGLCNFRLSSLRGASKMYSVKCIVV